MRCVHGERRGPVNAGLFAVDPLPAQLAPAAGRRVDKAPSLRPRSDGPDDSTGAMAVHIPTRLERLGDYRILREVGRGGMGVVYEAEQESLGRRVALKVLPDAALADAQQVLRFQREARAAARLHHTNIVPVFGVGQDDGHHYYVMQFIPGMGLDAVLDELRRLRRGAWKCQPARRPRSIQRGSQCGGSRRSDPHRTVLAGRRHQRDTRPGTTLAASSSAPLVRPAAVSRRAGGFLGGQPARRLGRLAGPVRPRSYLEPERLRGLVPHVPLDLETIVTKAIAREPAGRYTSAAALAEDLQRFLDDRPIKARRVTAAEQAWRWAWRNPAVAVAGDWAASGSVAGLAGVTWQWRKAVTNLGAAEVANRRAQARTAERQSLSWPSRRSRQGGAPRVRRSPSRYGCEVALAGSHPMRRM